MIQSVRVILAAVLFCAGVLLTSQAHGQCLLVAKFSLDDPGVLEVDVPTELSVRAMNYSRGPDTRPIAALVSHLDFVLPGFEVHWDETDTLRPVPAGVTPDWFRLPVIPRQVGRWPTFIEWDVSTWDEACMGTEQAQGSAVRDVVIDVSECVDR